VVVVVKRLKVLATCRELWVSGKPSNRSARGVDIPPTTRNLVFRTRTDVRKYVLHSGQEYDHVVALQAYVVAEPPELFRLKCASHRYTADINSTHFKRNNPLVCRVSARYNHGSTGSR
jgi:hypothetical protein